MFLFGRHVGQNGIHAIEVITSYGKQFSPVTQVARVYYDPPDIMSAETKETIRQDILAEVPEMQVEFVAKEQEL